ncbi:MAG: nitrous oxide reductase accessory protein NosL [Devosia sp.]|nr:nitrous oxide reductase accessory protein NosL [Devosia sp.]
MRPAAIVAYLVAALILGGCGGGERAQTPGPFALTESAIGRYCGMNVLEHPGPKGQIILSRAQEPIWFSSARDAVAFTMLPEEPKNLAAVYVSDMAKAPSWEEPGAENWIDATQAFFVIGSSMRGGMGAAETVPFSTETAARSFADENGGEVVGFAEIPRDYVLGSTPDNFSPGEESTPSASGMN